MSRRKYSRTRTTDGRWREQGRGQGELEQYRPWLTARDVPSQGMSYQVLGWHVPRQHEFLSNWEYYYFLHLEWAWQASRRICDIREQFPLKWAEETVAIAEKTGIAHPVDRATQGPLVLTTDFMITVRKGGQPTGVVRTIKPSRDLADRRTLEKLEIERIYWQEREVDWGIVTEHEMSMALVHNVEFIREQRRYAVEGLAESEAPTVAESLEQALRGEAEGFAEVCLDHDRRLGLPLGASLTLLKHQIAMGRWRVNMFERMDPSRPIVLRNPAEATETSQGAGR